MYKMLIATSFAALIAAVPALAQSPGGSATGGTEKAPSAQNAPSSKEKAPTQKGAQDSQKGSSQEKQKTSTPDRGKDAERDAAGTKEQRKTDKAADKDNQKAPGTKERSKSEAASEKSDDREKAGAGTKNGSTAAGGKSESGGKISISTEQRQKAKSVFVKHRSTAKVNIDLQVNVGTTVPRDVKLVAIPEDIIVIVPEYRRYKYFIVEEKVVIVDPDTFEVVEIIVIA